MTKRLSRVAEDEPQPATTADDGPVSKPAESSPLWLSGGTAVLDHHGKILAANDALVAWLGVNRSRLVGRFFSEEMGRQHPEWEEPLQNLVDRGAQFDRLELATAGDETSRKVEIELCCHEGFRFVRIESVLPPVRELEEVVSAENWGRIATHGLFNRLLRAEAQLDNLTYRWPGIIFSQRPDFSFIFVSPRIETLTGIPANEWRRQSSYFWQVVHEADSEALQKRLKQIKHAADGMTSTYRVRNIRTGRVSYLWEHRQAVYSSNGLLLGYEGIWLDITRQTIAERRLLSMSWKENLGTLTLGLAHDFCNIMTGIVSLSETFEKEFAQNDSLCGGLGMIRSSALQASELAHRIRQLHQGAPGEKNYHDLNEIVSNMHALLEKVLTKRVRVTAERDSSQLPIYVDAVELQQVIVNLALNAVDAMPSGGSLKLRTSRHESAPGEKPLQGAFPRAPLVRLTVQDTGIGIPQEYLHSIFDPYFTTKPLGQGSGLGLYNARLFAENHTVAITVESSPLTGTAFHLWFAETDFTEMQEVARAPQAGRQTLLVLGASDKARRHAVEMLQANQFYAVAASSMQEAIETLHSPDYQLSAVLFLAQRADGEEFALLQRIRAEKLPVKAFLSPIGLNQDEVDFKFLSKVDATLPQELPAQEFVARLKTLLQRA